MHNKSRSPLVTAYLLLLLLICSPTALAAPALIIDGADKETKKNIEAYIDLSSYDCNEAAWLLEYLQRSSRKKARQALEALGYYHATVEASIAHDEHCWHLKLKVKPGERTVIDKVDLQIRGEITRMPGFEALRQRILALQGQPLNHADYEKAKNDLELFASRYGFFSAKFTRRSLGIDRKHNRAEVQLHFDSGPRYHFGKIDIENELLGPKLLQQFMVIHSGDPFDSEKLTEQQQVLYDSGYFAAVEVIPLRHDNTKNEAPVIIRLKERKRHAYKLGIGYSTDTELRLSFGFENRFLNRRGHRYKFDTKWSPIENEASFGYGIPLGERGTHRLDLSLSTQSEKTDTSSSDTTQYGLVFSRNIKNGWKRTLGVHSYRESFITANDRETTQLLIPSAGISKTVLDNPLYPRNGWRLSLQSKFSRRAWPLSDIDLAQISGQARLIRPWNRSRILLRGSAGTTSTSDFSNLPATLRFYAGGDASVRGYGYKTLGPTDDEGNVNGGRNLLTGSAELEYPIRDRWGLAVFTDAGNAFDSFSDYEIHKSVGFGIRYHSFIGPIRIDLAFPLDADRNYRLHLSMGPDL